MLKILKKLTKVEWLLATMALIFIFIQVWMELKMPDYMSEITLLIETEGSEMHDVLVAGGKMLACAGASLICSMITAVCAAKVAANFSANLRGQMFHKVQSFSMEEIGKFSSSSLITRTTNDITQIQTLITMGLQVILKAPIMAIWAICKIAGKAWEWTLTTGIAVIVLMALLTLLIFLAMPKFRSLQRLTDNLNRVTRENLSGLSVVRAYNAEEYQQKKFDNANVSLTDASLFANRCMSFLMPSISLIMSGLSLAIYWIGAHLIENAELMEKPSVLADMLVFSQYAVQVIMSFMMLVMIFILYPRSQVAATRINEVLDTTVKVTDGKGVQNTHEKGEIVFDNVSFRYPDAENDALENISFTAHKGETIAFIGSTGCGKSSVINLIPRFYDVTGGSITVDGVNVKDYTLEQLRNKIGYISQRAFLFRGTVKSNVAFGDNGSDGFRQDDIVNAIYTAQANEFVEKMPEGYDSYIAQAGGNLSGGQKQRLSIARAICRNPEILIFDDSFSALDYKTDRTLRKTLNKECKDATKLIVAQRIGTIRDADKIIVLEDGKIAGMGTHAELMENCQVYKQIALSQLSKEELA